MHNENAQVFSLKPFYCLSQACVSLSKNVGEMRTETELLPQCWEQVGATLASMSCLSLLQKCRVVFFRHE